MVLQMLKTRIPLLTDTANMKLSKFAAFISFTACVFCCQASQVLADDSVRGQRVTVLVRSVKASNPAQGGGAANTEIDKRIEDLRSKLETLHFKSFRLLSTETRVVNLERKETMQVGEGSTLVVRPLYVQDHRVGMWLKWRDSTGANILDTRMHFSAGESMITGADQTGDTGVLLAIDVNPAD